MNIQLVIFDFDGLMVNSEHVVFEAVRKLLRTLGHELTWEFYCRYIGHSVMESLEAYFKEYPLDITLDEFIEKRNSVVQAALRQKLTLMPGLEPLLDMLSKRQIRMAIGTSGKRDYVEPMLEKFAIREYFETVVCIDDVTRGKPYPDIYLEVLRRTEVDAAQSIVLEDSPHGVQAAKAAGARCIAVPSQGVSRDLFIHADYVVDSLVDVQPILVTQ